MELIRSGALAGLGDFTSSWRDFEYVRGTLEAGQQDADSVKALYYKNDTIQSKAARDFLKCMRKSVGSMSYVQGFSDRPADVQQAEKEKK